jgi:hypothetical protein
VVDWVCWCERLDSACVDWEPDRLLLGNDEREGRRVLEAVLVDVPVELVFGRIGSTDAIVAVSHRLTGLSLCPPDTSL